MYTGQRFLVQQLLLQHLNVDVQSNNNALKELYDCIGGKLHLGPNVITFRTLLHLGQLLHLGLQHSSCLGSLHKKLKW